jgi:hypothetical protein
VVGKTAKVFLLFSSHGLQVSGPADQVNRKKFESHSQRRIRASCVVVAISAPSRV